LRFFSTNSTQLNTKAEEGFFFGFPLKKPCFCIKTHFNVLWGHRVLHFLPKNAQWGVHLKQMKHCENFAAFPLKKWHFVSCKLRFNFSEPRESARTDHAKSWSNPNRRRIQLIRPLNPLKQIAYHLPLTRMSHRKTPSWDPSSFSHFVSMNSHAPWWSSPLFTIESFATSNHAFVGSNCSIFSSYSNFKDPSKSQRCASEGTPHAYDCPHSFSSFTSPIFLNFIEYVPLGQGSGVSVHFLWILIGRCGIL
jgi:hypothetical protein